MSACIIRADCPVDNVFFLQFQFLATGPDGSIAGVHVASEVAFSATAEAVCFAMPQVSMEQPRP